MPVEVTFELDANGILHVLVLEKTTATRERLVITNDKVAILTTIFLGLRCSVLFCSHLCPGVSICACEGEAQRGRG